MNIFIDTEFTDPVDLDLISIGLVTEFGQTFYAERNDYDEALCNDFVRDTVIPLLGAPGAAVRSRADLKVEVIAWLAQFEQDRPVICYDFMGDWALLWDLCDKQTPKWLAMRNVRDSIDKIALENFFSATGLARHHALNDARGNAAAYRSGRPWW